MAFRPQILVPLLVVSILTIRSGFSQKSEELLPRLPADSPKGSLAIGQGGCAATGCHGRPEVNPETIPDDVWHESFTRWIDTDPHRKAYAVLEGKLGREISKKLHAGDPNIPEVGTKDSRCLACHTNPSLATPEAVADAGLDIVRAEGVGCEACHGNAEKWQISHVGWTDTTKRDQQFRDYGMRQLNDWPSRAKLCVGCHIGAPKGDGYPVRDMNHDMIAAGHPRLEFDFAKFHNALPKHWNEKHRGDLPDDPGEYTHLFAWLVGQVAVEEASCELLNDRMTRAASPRGVWPEFAEWNCSQCHHNLQAADWRAEATKSQRDQRKLGQPAWLGMSPLLQLKEMPPMFGESREKLAEKMTARSAKLRAIQPQDRAKLIETIGDFLKSASSMNANTHANWEEAVRLNNSYATLDIAIRDVRAKLKLPETAPNDDRAKLRKLLWCDDKPPRRVDADIRKPDSRWNWERGEPVRPLKLTVLQELPKALAKELKDLPTPTP